MNSAKQGDPQAIAAMINQSLQQKGITVSVVKSGSCLTIKAKSQTVPEKDKLVDFLRNGITKIKPEAISRVVVQGYAFEQSTAAWLISFGLDALEEKEKNSVSESSYNISSNVTPKTSNLAPSNSGPKLNILTRLFSLGRNRNGERFLIAFGTFILTSILWLSISSLNSTKNTSEITTQTSAVNTSESPSSSTPDVSLSNEVFTPKKIPILGNTYQQLEDESTILQIQLYGKTTDGRTEIPKASLAGITPNPIAVKKGYPPEGTDVCNLPYSVLIKQMYEQCFKDGMSYNQASNIAGWQGEEAASSGSTTTYRWGDGDSGSMLLVFDNGRLVSKSQSGLKP